MFDDIYIFNDRWFYTIWFLFIHNRFQMKNHDFDVQKYLHFHPEGFHMVLISLKASLSSLILNMKLILNLGFWLQSRFVKVWIPPLILILRFIPCPTLTNSQAMYLHEQHGSLSILHIKYSCYVPKATSVCSFGMNSHVFGKKLFLQINNSIWILCEKWK